jgi:hypothetical protein
MSLARRAAALAAGLALLVGGAAWAGQGGGTLEVTVNYAGPGEVDEGHALYLAIYPSADMQPDNLIGGQIATANGATVTFENVGAATVYLSGFYDEQGGWTGTTAVPSGSPAGAYVAEGSFAPSPIEVGAGETAQVEFTFNDLFRIP